MSPQLPDIVDVVRLQLGIDRVEPDDRLMETLGATSADIVNIIATLEERFGLEIDDADLAELASVRDLFVIVLAKLRPAR